MRRLFFVPVCLVGLACQSSQNVTRDELRTLIALPPAEDSPGKIQKCDLDALVAGAFTAPEASTRAASALASADQRLSPLTSALSAIDKAFEVCANNLANAETTAFKRTTAGTDPAGKPIFSIDFEQGSMENTGRQLDVGIQGQGFLKVKILPGIGDGFGYTRNGNFFVNKDGELVLGMGDGYKLQPGISIPKGTVDVSISTDGKVAVTVAGSLTQLQVGQLELYQFINPQGLNLLGGSIYTETQASGPPTQCKPGENGAGQVLQGFLEGSNVDPMKERLRMRFLQNWRATIVSVINESK